MEEIKVENNIENEKVEGNNKNKKSKKKAILIAIILILVIGIISFLGYYCCFKKSNDFVYQKVSYEVLNLKNSNFDNTNFVNMINSKDNYIIINDYSTYENILDDVNSCFISKGTDKNRYNEKFFKSNSLLAVECCKKDVEDITTSIELFEAVGTNAIVNVSWNVLNGTADIVGDIYFIPVSKNIQSADIEFSRSDEKIYLTEDKPIIYLYPTQDTEVSVELVNEENLTCTYPKYNGGWKVLAKTNGDLTDLETNRKLYALYYECESEVDFKVEKEGFVVRGEDTIKFLEEKLKILGLNERESEEFIIYWLPKLEKNNYNYIRFATQDEINENMEINISPKPDSFIRIIMTFKPLEKPINVKEQELITPERNGFVAVEWGGSEIK